jgi:hypothetical protein
MGEGDGREQAMRFVARTDLGGYGARAPAVRRAAETEIVKPFVLLYGPNGSGKTALLRMARAAMSLQGERAGRIVEQTFGRAPAPDDCGGDLGRLAAFVDGLGGRELCKSVPGVLDVGALGWAGQRSFLFDSRSDTGIAAATSFDVDVGYHLSRVVGGRRTSHGEFLGMGWSHALAWAFGLADDPDPYDGAGVPEARRRVFDAACPTGVRPAERWLFLDEPETALDTERLMAGLCALVAKARIGGLRVFCASHAPVFAAGLADHPSVQVLDLGRGGDWFGVQRRALAAATDPAMVGSIGTRVADDLARQARERRRAAERASSAEVTKALRGLGEPAGALLDAAFLRDGHRVRRDDGVEAFANERAREALERRGLMRLTGGVRHREGVLTELGVRAAERRGGRRGRDAS